MLLVMVVAVAVAEAVFLVDHPMAVVTIMATTMIFVNSLAHLNIFNVKSVMRHLMLLHNVLNIFLTPCHLLLISLVIH